MRSSNENGFTLVELMVAMMLFSILSVGFYQVMVSSVRGSNDASDISEIAEEARLGFNRMIRDTREATRLVVAEGDRYRIWTDFNRDGDVDANDFEYLEYAFDGEELTLQALTGPAGGDPDLLTGSEATLAGTQIETLAGNVEQVGADPIFTYASNFLTFDTDGDGETSLAELEAGTDGADDGELTGVELDYVSDINYAFRVAVGDGSRTFFGQAQIRNRRYSNL